ncbi:hypothetical protein E2C01_088036 [Portunus trituberculatus]|uniref:Uncharacterized protein n=1 Tax=Portunus trituberculatus TaxID=210409 RepID=A0A5B7JEB1_PORTR|nr:hypothetical protein [Portunus trituberculatus]
MCADVERGRPRVASSTCDVRVSSFCIGQDNGECVVSDLRPLGLCFRISPHCTTTTLSRPWVTKQASLLTQGPHKGCRSSR